jgi:hypothetical protein
MRAAFTTAVMTVAFAAWADEAPAAEAKPAAEVAAKSEPQPDILLLPAVCDQWDSKAMPEGAATVGYFEADVATGRRACPRTEVGVGGRFGAIIDVAHFYGNLGVNGVVSGSYAVNRKLEIYATLEAVSFSYVQTALKQTNVTLGHMTAGVTYQAYQLGSSFAGAISGRLLLPTSFQIPNARSIGIELGHASTWRPKSWLEVHTYLGGDFSAAISAGDSYPRFGGVLVLGAALTPLSWFSFVLDATGRLGAISYFAPTAALRFKVSSLGIELAGTLPLAGNDRHNFIAGLRLSWRFD